jgi:ribonuclease P protein component
VLAAHQRLRRADEFATAIRHGRRAGRDGLVVHVLTRSDAEQTRTGPAAPSRAGFVVPRAVGDAVVRNTVRRRLRHLLREELTRLRPGTDVVVRVLPEAAGRASADLRIHLRSALEAASTGKGRRHGR